MNKFLLKSLLVVLLATLLATPARAQGKLATVDLAKVFEKYWRKQEAEAALQDKRAEIQKQFNSFMDDYKKIQEDYKKMVEDSNDQTVTADERAKRRAAAETKLAEIKSSETTITKFRNDAGEELQSKEKRMYDTILTEIRTAISARAKAGNYAMVIDVSAETVRGMVTTPIVLYNNGVEDMTDKLVEQLNLGAPAPSEKSKGADTKSDDKAGKPVK